ncbi:hypothetical protein Taro_017921 [Colocasia esculenta]|uniref:Uncharacterized protein n=1 Tax=Colocasia esculenta TaxID=4460 RepID=A0A843UXJ4_COLES|nr:hypothetical protein [Colocasia esculenta]
MRIGQRNLVSSWRIYLNWFAELITTNGAPKLHIVEHLVVSMLQHTGVMTKACPPVDVAVAPAAATGGIPAPAFAVPATALEVAELRGQKQHLTGICLGLQTQLARQPAPAASLPQELQAESSH